MSKNGERIILVTGANGQQGGAAYQHLQKNGFKLRAQVRDLNSNQAGQLIRYGEKVFQGNLDDPDSLMRALDGVYGAFSMQPYMAKESGGDRGGEVAGRQPFHLQSSRFGGRTDRRSSWPNGNLLNGLAATLAGCSQFRVAIP